MEEKKELTAALKTRSRNEPVGPDDAGAVAAGPPVVESEFHRRWQQARVVLSLALFPGCPHVYLGQPVRGLVWSLLFLLVVLPFGFFLFFAWAFSESALFWVLTGLGAFVVLGAFAPVVHAFRTSSRRPDRRPSVGVALYAGVVATVVAAESGWFVLNYFETIHVASEFLEPLIGRGEEATILLSSYTRPVHGEVILFARSPDRAVREDSLQNLGRVIAKPGDAVSLQSGGVFVNGIRFDFERDDQRRELESAGRRVRRERLVTNLFSREADLSMVRDRRVSLRGEDWKLVLPAGSYLVVPDVRLPGAESASTPSRDGEPGVLAPSPVAWLVDRSDVVGRMIARPR